MIEWNVSLAIEHDGDVETQRYQTHRVEDDHHLISFGSSPLADVTIDDPALAETQCWLIVNEEGFTWLRQAADQSTTRFAVGEPFTFGGTTIRMTAPPVRAGTEWKLAVYVTTRGGNESTRQLRVFYKQRIIIGRSALNDLAFRDGNVSKRHCMLYIDDAGDVWMKDMGSTNGMWVNGLRASHQRLARGDRLYIGDYVIAIAELPKRVAI